MSTHPKVKEALEKTDSFIAKYPALFQYEKLKQLEQQSGYSKVYFLAAILLSIFTFLYGVGGFKFISDLACFAYPAYMSFKAIDTLEIEDDIQWLTYWIVFSALAFIETTGAALVEFIPFYFVFKIMFMIWLYHPKYQGATLVYKQVLRPVVYPYLCKMSPIVDKKE